MPAGSVATCILARNAAALLPAAAESVRGLSGPVLLGDLGSNDDGKAVCAAMGVAVVDIPWREDFAEARNALVQRAFALDPGVQWAFWLNASERLQPESLPRLLEAVARPDAAAISVRVRNRYAAGSEMTTVDVRLWRRHPALGFVGRLHPHLRAEFKEAIARDGLSVQSAEIDLVNVDPLHGESLGQTQQRARLQFNARLLELELRDRPGQLHYEVQLGRVLLALGEASRGHETMRAAAERVAPSLGAPAPPAASVQDLLTYLVRSAQPVPAHAAIPREKAAELALRWFPRSPALLTAVAEAFFAVGQYQSAAAILERLLHLGETATYDPSGIFDPGLVGDDARMNLAACYRRLGRGAEAASLYRALLSSPHFAAGARTALAELDRG